MFLLHLHSSVMVRSVGHHLCRVSYIFGVITMMSGIVGVPLGTILAQTLKKRYPRADPLICAGGLLCSAPFLLSAMFVVSTNTTAAYVLIFFGSVSLNLNWAIVADILLVRKDLDQCEGAHECAVFANVDNCVFTIMFFFFK